MSGRVALVTGGSRGIGLACARRLQAGGDRVVVTYKNAPPQTLAGATGTVPITAMSCDVTSPAEVGATFEKIEADIGPVEVLVCSAGINDDSLLLRMGEERWESVISTNLTACYRVTKRVIGPMVKARNGRVVLISSVVAMTGNAGQTNYAAAKAGLIGFGRSLAREVASRNITVNVISPGLIATDMLASVTDKHLAELAASVPLGRLGDPEEVAATVSFLVSAEASYLTGAIIPVDGGLGMGH